MNNTVAFIFCLVVGFIQTALLSVTLSAALDGNMKKAVVALLLKMLIYGAGFTVLYFLLFHNIIYGGIGFIAGVICSVIFIVVKGKIKNTKGDDTGDNSRHN